MKNKYLIGTSILVLIFIIYCSLHLFVEGEKKDEYMPTEEIRNGNTWESQIYSEAEILCYNFLLNKLSSNAGGIYTNHLKSDEILDYATGYEILSESSGLIMLYYVEKDNQTEFDKQIALVEKAMVNKVGLLRWRILEDDLRIGETSASIDDLRIIRSLIYAHDKWGDVTYLNKATDLAETMLQYNVTEENLNNYYNVYDQSRASEIDLAYIDLLTMKELSQYNRKWHKLYKNGVKLIKKGYISDVFPFYLKKYNFKRDEFSNEKRVNMIDSLLVVLHLCEVGLVEEDSIDWLREQILEEGIIYSSYNIVTGMPATHEQSTAVYAIAARIAKEEGDQELYDSLIQKMLQLQVSDETSTIYGSFGDANTLEVFSFDNLQALLALIRRR